MLAINENLRHRGAACAPDHLVAPPRLLVDVDLVKGDALLLQQRAGSRAIGAPRRRIHLDLGHRCTRSEIRPQWGTYGAPYAIRQSAITASRSIPLGRL